MKWSRRGVLALGAWSIGGLPVLGQLVDKDPYELKPGEYTWHPERTGEGPVAIIVSLPEQLVFVYRNGIRVASSTCSTGKPGHSTPTGVFTILQKDKNHHSATYDNAPMPNMNRLTWSGIALHAGNLPGYPASHGCVRLPLDFSGLLFGITHVGTAVIIANAATQPADVTHPGMTLSNYAEHEFDTVVGHLDKNHQTRQAAAPESTPLTLAAVISSAEKKGYLFENGNLVATGDVVIADPTVPLGSHMFVLSRPDDGTKGLVWHAMSYAADKGAPAAPTNIDVIKRIRAAPAFITAMQARMHPGMTLVLTDAPAAEATRTANGFVIVTDDATS